LFRGEEHYHVSDVLGPTDAPQRRYGSFFSLSLGLNAASPVREIGDMMLPIPRDFEG
jgi:hypothetical protein